MARTKKCTAATRTGRLAKAVTFLESALTVLALADHEAEVSDAAVTLLVHAGIAASDVICCARLGEHAQGESHSDAVALLRTADAALAKDLQVLLGMKTQAGYGALSTTSRDLTRAARSARRLVEASKMAT